MRLKARHKSGAVIPTASMADIAFLLIVFFMITMTFEKDKTTVTLPQTDLRLEIPPDVAVISVAKSGALRASDGEAMSSRLDINDCVSFAANVMSIYPGRPVVLKADDEVPYEKVDKVLDCLKQARVELIYLLSDAQRVEDGDGQEGQ